MSIKSRSEVSKLDTWNLEAIFKSEKEWNDKFIETSELVKKIGRFRGTLYKSAPIFKEAIEESLKISRSLELLYNYAHLRADEDTSNSHYQGLLQKSIGLYAESSTATAFINPEILAMPTERFEEITKDDSLKPYLRMIDEIVRYRPHTLSDSEEKLLAMGTEVFMGPHSIYSQLNNADFDFGNVTEDGEKKPLTHSTYSLFMRSNNREVREEAFKKHYKVYGEHKNALAAVLGTSIRGDVFMARARKHKSALESSLFPDRVAVEVYDNLIKTVRENSSVLARYYKLKAKVLKLNKLESYDTLVSPVADVKFHHTYDQAANLILESLKPLGEEYCSVLEKGFFEERWVDRYENKGKRSGAYSSGCYDSPPFMLMNFKEDSIEDVFTLAHEAGHSMHSYFSHQHQPYQDSGYPIITAEVASTFNEQLLFHHLDLKITDPQQRLFLINQHLDEINGTLFRQAMYADFERETHARIEAGDPLTVESFTGIWGGLLEKYYGEGVNVTSGSELGCFRIPHFYSAFYVYKYATGISAAIQFADKVLRGEPGATERYLGFLKSGGSKPPLETLKIAGVDLTSPEPIKKAINLFDSLLRELETGLKLR